MKKERLRPILIEGVEPAVDDGRYPCKREVGDRLEGLYGGFSFVALFTPGGTGNDVTLTRTA